MSLSPTSSSSPDHNKEKPTNDKNSHDVSTRDALLKKLDEIPYDQLKQIVTNQLDLEIRLKHKELNMSDNEISKIESQLLVLRNFLNIQNDLDLPDQPNELTTKYYTLLNQNLTATYNKFKTLPDNASYEYGPTGNTETVSQSNHSYRTRSTTSSLRPSSTTISTPKHVNLGCLYRRTDGVVVRLICPDCLRSNFSSAQGFLNHSRIAHSKEYTSQDAAALKCGEVTPEIPQDSVGENSIRILNEKGLDPAKNLNINEILITSITNPTIPSAIESNQERFEFPKSETTVQETTNSNTSPTTSNELMKKLVREGKMKSAEYESLLSETKLPVNNAHLFEDESEESESSLSAGPSSTSIDKLNDKKRRQSRGGININISSIDGPDEKKSKRN
ncbi:uncharacterized protein KGF55_003848 [Candida pseudojiufengensis]|uniref:uncharacterized protein n=1 Tax=Candida pseudojiufengensis TaxID=497109 RepID=UPI0022256D4A|nr:uncharacterized protein KGF55_003848 [Candida pseudojiufengensis]KAI5961877.1 hypothetical protein KGF55_003848 [Candida pseudojiufengensis]